jgi:hypothetical protein
MTPNAAESKLVRASVAALICSSIPGHFRDDASNLLRRRDQVVLIFSKSFCVPTT